MSETGRQTGNQAFVVAGAKASEEALRLGKEVKVLMFEVPQNMRDKVSRLGNAVMALVPAIKELEDGTACSGRQ